MNEVIAQLAQATADVPLVEIPRLLGCLEQVKAGFWAKLVTHNGKAQPLPSTEPDKLLFPEDAAALLNVKTRWLYDHWKQLPFARKLSRKALRFSEAGLRRWQATRRA